MQATNQLKTLSLIGSVNLGSEEPLPDRLFEGLTSLAELDSKECRCRRFPNMDDLTALVLWRGTNMDIYMGVEGEESESATKFDHLVSATSLTLESNNLVRVPSVKNMARLQTLSLSSNKITMLAPGDLFGATSLVYFGLSNNLIVSVAPEAFVDLASFRVAPEAFNPKDADGSPVLPAYGIGLWLHTGQLSTQC